MTILRTSGTFDFEQVAREFPGALTFRGAPASSTAETEIEGAVPFDTLFEAIRRAQIVPSEIVPVTAATALPRRRSFKHLIPWAGVVALLIELTEIIR